MMREMRRRGYKFMGTKRHLDHLSKGDLFDLFPAFIVGAEGEEDEGKGDDDKGGDEGKGNTPPDDDDKGDDDEDEDKDKDTKGLKSALRKERAAAKEAQKELKRLQGLEEERELSKKSDLEKAQHKEQAALAKAEKLSAGLLRRDIDAAIAKAANASKFIDTDDAINGVDRSALTYSQDKDDPTDITIDYKTVETAVKALATKKPHFINRGTEDGDATGGQFGGSKGKKPTNEEALIAKYPALQ